MLELLTVELLVAVPVVAVLALVAVAIRSRGLQRAGGAVEVSLRLASGRPDGGWSNGIGRFVDDELRWYRVFSLSPRPRRRLPRHELAVTGRRVPRDGERRALQAGSVVLCCAVADEERSVELAMQPRAVTGFLAWLESGPPGRQQARVGPDPLGPD